MKLRRIAVVTGTRADYGLLKGVLERLRRAPGVRLQLLVTGQHLMPRFGDTVREIQSDGFRIAARVDLRLEGDREEDVAGALAEGIRGFSAAFRRLRPHLLVVLGDRFEILAAACAAVPFRLPIAHIHGGEATEGLIDEQIRHAVTKLSHLHFPATSAYRRRILRMGEDPRRVFCFGAPGLDGVRQAAVLDGPALRRDLGVPSGPSLGVVTFHPVTLEKGSADRQSRELLRALAGVPGVFWIFTLPNLDLDCSAIIRNVRAFAQRHPDRAAAHASLGRTRYLSLLRHAAVMVGNSSSGLLEAPSFRLPAVNIGDRQRGRLRARNVIDVPECAALHIRTAVRRALTPSFRRGLRGLRNPYAGRDACRRIVETLARVPLDGSLLKKAFHDS